MNSDEKLTLSVVAPVYNEADYIEAFHSSLVKCLEAADLDAYEVIYCDDGSSDDSLQRLHQIAKKDKAIRIISLSRNFGKEIAITAGLHQAQGSAILTIDSDGQHPVELIPDFIKAWRGGAKVVVGIRTDNQKEGLIKRYGSRLFYKVLGRLVGLKLVPGATDFRLIDRVVQREFIKMTERNRITRGLIGWLGYSSSYIEFKANRRSAGKAGYSFKKLMKLAVDSIISLSLSPLYISAYIGALVLPISALVVVVMVINALLGDPLQWHATASAYVVVTLVFLVGILLVSQGIIGLYLSHIHTETQNRPLYVIDKDQSVGINET